MTYKHEFAIQSLEKLSERYAQKYRLEEADEIYNILQGAINQIVSLMFEKRQNL